MNGDIFKTWFEGIIKLLPNNSVIVMDNAPYNSMMIERIPNSAWRKADIVAWLQTKNIGFDGSSVKVELLHLVLLVVCVTCN